MAASKPGRPGHGGAPARWSARSPACSRRGGGGPTTERAPERPGLGRERVDLALGLVQTLAQLAHTTLGLGGVALRALVHGGVLIGRTLRYEFGIGLGERRLRLGPAQPGGIQRSLLTLDRRTNGVETRRGRLGRPSQSREPHVVLGDESTLRGDVGVERVELGTRPRDVTCGRLRGVLRIADAHRDVVDLGPGLVDRGLRHDLSLQRELPVVFEQSEALPCEAVQSAEPLLHLLEPEGRGPSRVDRLRPLLRLELGEAPLEVVGLVLQHHALGVALLLRARMIGELCAQGDELVGVEPGLRVANDGGDRGGLASDLRLLAEGLELAAHLPGQVAQPRQVRLHRVELAKRLLLAAAVLEDSGGLLDESPPVFGRGLQHGIQSPLPDDDVHLASETRVAQQLLHVEQAARLAVDRVLTRAVAEEGATDRHLAVVDRQRPVAVVDRQLHLGAAERSARGRAGEDDVFHLSAAQGLRALLAHDPGECVDDVRLARAVRSDDARDPGLQDERGRLRERLEAFERDALQVHPTSFALVGWRPR